MTTPCTTTVQLHEVLHPACAHGSGGDAPAVHWVPTPVYEESKQTLSVQEDVRRSESFVPVGAEHGTDDARVHVAVPWAVREWMSNVCTACVPTGTAADVGGTLGSVQAALWCAVLRYPTGGHFCAHVDSVRGAWHYGTLVMVPPGQAWQGAQLRLLQPDMSPAVYHGPQGWDAMHIPRGHAHCVTPVTAGQRVVMVVPLLTAPAPTSPPPAAVPTNAAGQGEESAPEERDTPPRVRTAQRLLDATRATWKKECAAAASARSSPWRVLGMPGPTPEKWCVAVTGAGGDEEERAARDAIVSSTGCTVSEGPASMWISCLTGVHQQGDLLEDALEAELGGNVECVEFEVQEPWGARVSWPLQERMDECQQPEDTPWNASKTEYHTFQDSAVGGYTTASGWAWVFTPQSTASTRTD